MRLWYKKEDKRDAGVKRTIKKVKHSWWVKWLIIAWITLNFQVAQLLIKDSSLHNIFKNFLDINNHLKKGLFNFTDKVYNQSLAALSSYSIGRTVCCDSLEDWLWYLHILFILQQFYIIGMSVNDSYVIWCKIIWLLCACFFDLYLFLFIFKCNN